MHDHYDQPSTESFCNKLGILQYNAALAITGLIQKTSKVKLHHELGLKSLNLEGGPDTDIVFIKSKILTDLSNFI